MIALKDQSKPQQQKHVKILEHMCLPKSIFSDQGVGVLKFFYQKFFFEKHTIKIIFVLGRASFVENLNNQ